MLTAAQFGLVALAMQSIVSCLLSMTCKSSKIQILKGLFSLEHKSLTLFKQVETPHWQLCASRIGNRRKNDVDEI